MFSSIYFALLKEEMLFSFSQFNKILLLNAGIQLNKINKQTKLLHFF